MGRHDCPDDDYYRCLCNTHVHKGTFIIGILGVVFNFPFVFSAVQSSGGAWYFGVSCGVNIFSLLTYVCLIVGNRKEIPCLYLPFLIVNTIILIFMILFAIGMFVVAGLSFGHKLHLDNSDAPDGAIGGVAIAIAILYIIFTLIQFYFFYVVYRGYRYLKDVLLDPSSNLPRVN